MHATATITHISNKKAVVDITYGDGHTGFFTVEEYGVRNQYEKGYAEADMKAKEHGCRLERFSREYGQKS